MFFLDLFGNRLLIAVVAGLHVFINHPLAVGAYPLVVLMEWWGWKHGSQEWDRLAYRVTFALFIITTSIGALTGVGIWFVTALIAPFGIGSLLRVFFWAWFSEWLVFISEVGLILVYFLTWKHWCGGGRKRLHIAVGVVLSIFSWFTVAIIVAVLGFMMDSGGWPVTHGFISAFFNPIYLPQLAFRTTFALGLAGLCIWFVLFFVTAKGSYLRRQAVRFCSLWLLVWIIPFVAASLWYWHVVPDMMQANIDVALLTQKFVQWHESLALIMGLTIAAIFLIAVIGAWRPRIIPGVALLIPFLLGLWLLGHFERVREFIRKPYVIADYIYSNGVRVAELPIFQRDGILPYAAYVSHHRVTSDDSTGAGKDVFLVACSRCHTTAGINGVARKFENLYGPGEWDHQAMLAFIRSMHVTRTFMPPFPGNEREAGALVAYIMDQRRNHRYIFDAQTDWITDRSEKVPPVSQP